MLEKYLAQSLKPQQKAFLASSTTSRDTNLHKIQVINSTTGKEVQAYSSLFYFFTIV